MIVRLITLAVVLWTLAQLPGCHYYIEGMPRFIVSSEAIPQPPTPVTNYD